VFATARAATEARSRPAQDALRALVEWMGKLPGDREGFGLTHADLHLGNLAVDGTVVTAFDFDDSCLHWFVHDVAVAVTSIRKAAWECPGEVDAAAVEARFLDGYFGRGVLAPIWRARTEAFVAYRIALSACWASGSFQAGELEGEMLAWYERSLPWWLGQLALRREDVARAMAV
jgi:Ser/Thr protein kinase RdoA (MazF antagonist)